MLLAMQASFDEIAQRVNVVISKFRLRNNEEFSKRNETDPYSSRSVQRQLVKSKEAFVAELKANDEIFNLKLLYDNTKNAEVKANVVGVCEEIAMAILDCGDLYFRLDKNATVFLDENFMAEANTFVNVFAVSDKMKQVLEATFHSWHWHGW
jgi:hypothetical protein